MESSLYYQHADGALISGLVQSELKLSHEFERTRRLKTVELDKCHFTRL